MTIHILIAEINKVLLAEATPCLNARGHRFGSVTTMPASRHARISSVASVGNGFEFVDAEDFLRPTSDVGELRSIRAIVRNLMRDDQVMFGIDRDLHIVADHAGAAPAGRHRAAVGIGQLAMALVNQNRRLLTRARDNADKEFQRHTTVLLPPPRLNKNRWNRARFARVLAITDGGTPFPEGGFPDPARKSVPSVRPTFHAKTVRRHPAVTFAAQAAARPPDATNRRGSAQPCHCA